MSLPLYLVNAFTDTLFTGNPAAVVLNEQPLAADLMQKIAAEHRLSETAFVTPDPVEAIWALRWFTPTTEAALCGHATLAAAYVLFHEVEDEVEALRFATQSGVLTAHWEGDRVRLDLPVCPVQVSPPQPWLIKGLGSMPTETFTHERRWLVRLRDADAVRDLKPDLKAFLQAPRGVIVTAEGDGELDFVSRFFAPALGVPEDPVTGSAHCSLASYWSSRLNKTRMEAAQLSARGGRLTCEVAGERVRLWGQAALYARGEIAIEG